MRTFLLVLAVCVAAGAVFVDGCGGSSAGPGFTPPVHPTPSPTPTFTEYALPAGNAGPGSITAGPDGALWFTPGGDGGNFVGRITTADTVTEYVTPTKMDGSVEGIVAGSDGALWFDELGKVGRITTTGTVTEYALPSDVIGPTAITSGPDGALWMAVYVGNRYSGTCAIGHETTGGSFTYFPTADCAYAIITGPDGALWFTDGGQYVWRLTSDGKNTNFFTIPTLQAGTIGITVGSDGSIWVTEFGSGPLPNTGGNKIARITTLGVVTEYPLALPDQGPDMITTGGDGALWFTEHISNKIGRITTTGSITEYPIPTPSSYPVGIAVGPDGALWFAELGSNKIGRLKP